MFGAVEVVFGEGTRCAPDAYLGDMGGPGGSGGRVRWGAAKWCCPLGGWFPAVEPLSKLFAPGFELTADAL